MNEYQIQAKNFLRKANAKMKITHVANEINPLWNDNLTRKKYRVTITTPQGKTSFFFWDSIYNFQNNIIPTEYDILACLQKYDVGTFDDFVNEFGYAIEYTKNYLNAKRIYKMTCKEYENLCRIFTPEQMEELREIY